MNEQDKSIIEKQFGSFCCKVSKHALIDYIRTEESRKRRTLTTLPFSCIDDYKIVSGDIEELDIFADSFQVKGIDKPCRILYGTLYTVRHEYKASD